MANGWSGLRNPGAHSRCSGALHSRISRRCVSGPGALGRGAATRARSGLYSCLSNAADERGQRGIGWAVHAREKGKQHVSGDPSMTTMTEAPDEALRCSQGVGALLFVFFWVGERGGVLCCVFPLCNAACKGPSPRMCVPHVCCCQRFPLRFS